MKTNKLFTRGERYEKVKLELGCTFSYLWPGFSYQDLVCTIPPPPQPLWQGSHCVRCRICCIFPFHPNRWILSFDWNWVCCIFSSKLLDLSFDWIFPYFQIVGFYLLLLSGWAEICQFPRKLSESDAENFTAKGQRWFLTPPSNLVAFLNSFPFLKCC